MQERDLFEYAVIRFVPRVEREEFLHVGVVLFCKKQKFLKAYYQLDRNRLDAFCPGFDIPELREYLEAFCRICEGTEKNSPIATLDAIERFRWLTANRSTVVQVSAVHPGLCLDAEDTLSGLFRSLVL